LDERFKLYLLGVLSSLITFGKHLKTIRFNLTINTNIPSTKNNLDIVKNSRMS